MIRILELHTLDDPTRAEIELYSPINGRFATTAVVDQFERCFGAPPVPWPVSPTPFILDFDDEPHPLSGLTDPADWLNPLAAPLLSQTLVDGDFYYHDVALIPWSERVREQQAALDKLIAIQWDTTALLRTQARAADVHGFCGLQTGEGNDFMILFSPALRVQVDAFFQALPSLSGFTRMTLRRPAR